MSKNIYNIRLTTGMELISEMLSIDEMNEVDEKIAELFTEEDAEDSVLLSHPIVVLTVPMVSNGEAYLENFYHPYLHHSKHACVIIDSDLIMSIDELHPNAIPDYIEAVIAVYGHMYEDSTEETSEPDTDPSLPTVH